MAEIFTEDILEMLFAEAYPEDEEMLEFHNWMEKEHIDPETMDDYTIFHLLPRSILPIIIANEMNESWMDFGII